MTEPIRFKFEGREGRYYLWRQVPYSWECPIAFPMRCMIPVSEFWRRP